MGQPSLVHVLFHRCFADVVQICVDVVPIHATPLVCCGRCQRVLSVGMCNVKPSLADTAFLNSLIEYSVVSSAQLKANREEEAIGTRRLVINASSAHFTAGLP